jgi:hypothetical protein
MPARTAARSQSAQDPNSGGYRAGRADLVPVALYREERGRVEALNQQLRDRASLVGMLHSPLEVAEAWDGAARSVTGERERGPRCRKPHSSAGQRPDYSLCH